MNLGNQHRTVHVSQALSKHFCPVPLLPIFLAFAPKNPVQMLQRNHCHTLPHIESMTAMIRQNNRAVHVRDIFWAEKLSFPSSSLKGSCSFSNAVSSSCAATQGGSALNRVNQMLGEIHSVPRFGPADTPENGWSSLCELHFPQEIATSPKSKAQRHRPGICEIPESLSFITKVICEHKQMWSTNMAIN